MATDALESGAESLAGPGRPVATAERIATLDFIRGIAVLGILLADIAGFAHPYAALFWPPAHVGGMTEGDQWVWVTQFVLVDGKFRGLFSLLFGAGVMLFIERAWARGSSRWLQFRRLAWLLAFGLVHCFLIWRGDILTLYAVCGMILLPTVKWQAKTQLRVGLGLYAFGALVLTMLMAGQYATATMPAVQAQMDPAAIAEVSAVPQRTLDDVPEETALYRDGSWVEIASYSISNHGGQLLQEVLIVAPLETIPLMLIGMALYRLGFFGGGWNAARMRRWGWIGFAGGGLLTVPVALWVHAGGFEFYRTLLAFNGIGAVVRLPMILGLLALLTVWAPRAVNGGLGARLAAAGRMAFSNYLGTSIVMVGLFQGWGLGLFGQFHRIELLGFVALAWIAMLACSPWWLARYNYGPLEWLWRCLTYGRLFPLRRTVRV